jgi:hypothetical protein
VHFIASWVLFDNNIYYAHVGFFVVDTIIGVDWQMVVQNEPCSRHAMVETNELMLGVDIGGEEHGLGVELGYENNIGQEYNGEARK